MFNSITTAYRECRRLTRRHAKSFYFASHALPRAKRSAAYALYAFCRYVDDCVDQAPPEAPVEAALAQAREWIGEAAGSNQPPVILSESKNLEQQGASTCVSAKATDLTQNVCANTPTLKVGSLDQADTQVEAPRSGNTITRALCFLWPRCKWRPHAAKTREWIGEAAGSNQSPVILSEVSVSERRRRIGWKVLCWGAFHPNVKLRSPLRPDPSSAPTVANATIGFAQEDTVRVSSIAHPLWLPAFQETVRRWKLSPEVLNQLVDGMAMDRAEKIRMPDWPALENYCYHVASVVGLAMLPILAGPEAEEETLARLGPAAAALGTAMQLTNILRDVGEDWQQGRVYLPADELAAAELSLGDIAAGYVGARWQNFLARQIARARQLYAHADAGIDALPRDGSRQTARRMRVLYAEILRVIEENGGDVFTRRAYVPLWRKCWLAVKAWE